MPITFTVTKADQKYLEAILKRSRQERHDQDPVNTLMCLTACHANGCRLDLERLLNSPKPDFFYDMNGICTYLNKLTGKIDAKNFWPRSAIRSLPEMVGECRPCGHTVKLVFKENAWHCNICNSTKVK